MSLILFTREEILIKDCFIYIEKIKVIRNEYAFSDALVFSMIKKSEIELSVRLNDHI